MRSFDFVPEGAPDCCVTAWLHRDGTGRETAKKPGILICPGGGYGGVSGREAEPVAQVYSAAGFHTFILRYSVLEQAKDLKPLIQLAWSWNTR